MTISVSQRLDGGKDATKSAKSALMKAAEKVTPRLIKFGDGKHLA